MIGYRTYVASGLIAIFGVLSMTDWISFMNNPKAGLVALGSALLMAVLRTITTTPPLSPTPVPTPPVSTDPTKTN